MDTFYSKDNISWWFLRDQTIGFGYKKIIYCNTFTISTTDY
jgi:hypothetical protein